MSNARVFWPRSLLALRIGVLPLVVATLFSGSLPGEEPTSGPPPQMGPDAIRQDQPSFLVRAEVNHATRSYLQGDTLALRVTSEEDAFVYVIFQQADGKLYQVFPNSIQPENRIKARQAVRIPADDDLFRVVIGAPFGKELIKVIASKEPIDPLADPSMRQAPFNPLSGERLKGVEFALGDRDAAGWAEDQIEIVTHPRDQAQEHPGAKRFGVFFGVANYEFDAERREFSEGKSQLNLPTCHRDARQMAEILQEVGQLNAVQVRTNELATRKNLEQAITGWLASVSRPGDTVVIYFSGHGMKLADDNGDEADGQDELLVPYDFIDAGILEVLLKRQQEGKLDPALVPRVEQAKATIGRAGSLERGIDALMRQAAVSDDLFGHWLQRLSGREVVVILDSCFSGGFAAQEKGALAASQADGDSRNVDFLGFDFLDQECGRLKDLGQRETALLSACGAQETAGVRLEGDLSIMTRFLLDGIVGAPGSLTLENGFERCREGMHVYFEQVNRARAGSGLPPLAEHRPCLVDYCARPPLLKP